MRFRYFDSGGNEVSLSTTAALAVKIDLGEVTETTLLYDAACDQWAPAGEQEIFRHILEHGSADAPAEDPVAEETLTGSGDDGPTDGPETFDESFETVPSTPARGGPKAPPLEDFWGPAMSTRQDEEEAMEAFDLSLEGMTAEERAEDRSGRSGERGDDLSLDVSGEAAGEESPGSGPAGAEEGPPAGDAEPASSEVDRPAAPPAGPSADRPGVETPEEERLAAASEETAEEEPAPASRRRRRTPDESLARLEKIAREAADRMEREEEARRRGPGPSLGDRMAEGARKGGQKTGQALKTGAAASARALSEGGKATAESVGAGVRALGKRARKAGPEIRRGMAAMGRGVASAVSGALSAVRGGGGRIGSGVAAGVRSVGVAAGFVGRGIRAVFLAPVRGVAGVWRTLAPLGGRAGRDARKAVGGGIRGVRRTVSSPLALGLVLFVAVFLFFTYGGGLERGEELWEATVGIARSVAAEAEADAADAASEAAVDPSGATDAGSASPGGPLEDPLLETPVEPDEGVELAAAPGDSAGTVGESAVDGGDSTLADSPVVGPGANAALVAEFERELGLASRGALEDMIAGMDSLGAAYQLPEAPPGEWLGGYYLSHASEFHSVRQYWARYRGYIRSVKAQDAVLYRRGLEARFAELGVPRDRITVLTGVAERRFREGRLRRDSLYDAMADVAEAAVDLHDFLAENEAGIEYDPVRPGRVSREPVLEAWATSPELKTEMDARLDRILETMERVHGLKPVFTRELQDVLFSSLQAAEAVDTFRLGPRDAPPDSGGPPPGG